MKTIRNNVFETNSSSCHSLTFFDDVREHDFEKVSRLYFSADKYFYGGDCYISDATTKGRYYSCALASYIELQRENLKRKYYLRKKIISDDMFLYDDPNYFDLKIKVKQLPKKEFENNYHKYSWLLKCPEKIVQQIQDLLNTIKNSLNDFFKQKNIEIIWTDIENPHHDWTMIKSDGNIDTTECIDHQSDALESNDCYRLAELYKNPENLYNWILDKNCTIYLGTN